MKNSQEQIIKALSGLIPEDAQSKVSEAVSEFIKGAVAELEDDMNGKLEEAYKQITEERAADVKIAEEGYKQAWDIITDLRNRLEIQKEEFDRSLEEGYEEAYQMLQEERAKNDTLEVQLYEEYDKRTQDIKEFMIDKIDQFLQLQGEKYYEMAKRDVNNDPTLAERRLAFDKILEVAATYLSDDDYNLATNSRVSQLEKALDEVVAQKKIVEAKNVRLMTENNKLVTETASHKRHGSERVITEQKARTEKARKVEGRGQGTLERQVVLGEYNTGEAVAERKSDDQDSTLTEQIGENVERVINDWKRLSGLDKQAE